MIHIHYFYMDANSLSISRKFSNGAGVPINKIKLLSKLFTKNTIIYAHLYIQIKQLNIIIDPSIPSFKNIQLLQGKSSKQLLVASLVSPC
jgi:hypothetical protein